MYTLEVYQQVYSYISVQFVSLSIVARENCCSVRCWNGALVQMSDVFFFFVLNVLKRERETEQMRKVFVLFEDVLLSTEQIGDGGLFVLFQDNYCENTR